MFSKPLGEGEDEDNRKKPRYSRLDAKDVPVASVDDISLEIHNKLKCENKKRLTDSSRPIKELLGGCLRQHFLDDDQQLNSKVLQIVS